jgi:hypothetical protein
MNFFFSQFSKRHSFQYQARNPIKNWLYLKSKFLQYVKALVYPGHFGIFLFV